VDEVALRLFSSPKLPTYFINPTPTPYQLSDSYSSEIKKMCMPNSINLLVFVVETEFVCCEAGTDFCT